MGYIDYLKELLRPMGVYDLEDGAGAAEISAIGRCLDKADTLAEITERETCVKTAEGYGLEMYEKMLPFSASFSDSESRRRAVAALLSINDASFSVSAINGALAGCGIKAEARETDEMFFVTVHFPNYNAVPYNIDRIDEIISKILPCHVGYEYVYTYPTWDDMAGVGSFGEIQSKGSTWDDLEHYTA